MSELNTVSPLAIKQTALVVTPEKDNNVYMYGNLRLTNKEGKQEKLGTIRLEKDKEHHVQLAEKLMSGDLEFIKRFMSKLIIDFQLSEKQPSDGFDI